MKVSIIVPVYNVEKYLSKCLDSLLSQTLNDIEILVIDDGSTDHSPDIIQEYSSRSDKIHAFRKPNGGLSDARNYAFSHITGEYTGFIDSDDFVDSDMYETLYQRAIETNADIVECNLHHTWSDHEDTEYGEKFTDQKQLLMNGRSVVWNKIYKTEWLKSTGVSFPTGLIYEDVNFYSKLIPFLAKIEYVDQAFVHYVQRNTSINNHQSLKTLQIIDILNDILSFYKANGFYDEYQDALEFLFTRILLCSSMGRMSRIPDKSDRQKALALNWQELVSNFPSWRQNRYLKQYHGKNALFMKSITSYTYQLYASVLPIIFQLKK